MKNALKSFKFGPTMICFTCVAMWAFFMEPRDLKREATTLPTAEETIAQSEDAGRNAEQLETVIGKAVHAIPDVRSPAGARQDGADIAAPFKYVRELIEYSKLRSKVFLSDEAKAQKERLLQNVDLLRAIEMLLKSGANNSRSQEMQNDAIDLLLEARATDSGGAAESVMRSVIEDNQIENSSVDIDKRRMLAGIKAEILYQWSSMDPDRSDDMRKWLPGPVSEKIWRNVVDAHSQNDLESAAQSEAR